MTPSTRPARPADLPACRALQSLLPERAPALLDAGVGVHLVAGPPGAPVGYVLAVGAGVNPTTDGGVQGGPVDAGGPPDASDDPGRRAPALHLVELVVAPDARRSGVGGALVDACRARAGALTALVDPENEAALALYESRGFERVCERADAFDSGPALVLRRPAGLRS